MFCKATGQFKLLNALDASTNRTHSVLELATMS